MESKLLRSSPGSLIMEAMRIRLLALGARQGFAAECLVSEAHHMGSLNPENVGSRLTCLAVIA